MLIRNHSSSSFKARIAHRVLCWVSSYLGWKRLSTYPTASHSPVGQYPSEKIWLEKSCCRTCFPPNWCKSHCRTVLSNPPVHNFVPSGEMSIQDAPSVWPWNVLRIRLNSDKIEFVCTIYLIVVWLCKSQTAMLPSEQQEKHIFESGDMARA